MNLDMGVIKDFSALLTAIAGVSFFVSNLVFANKISEISKSFNVSIEKLIDEIKEDRGKLYADSERITKIDESVKSAHKRIDKLEDR